MLLLGGQQAAGAWRIAGHSGGPISAVAANGTLLYIAIGFRLHVYDVSEPAAPRELGSTTAFGDFISDVALAGTRAYVTAGRDGLHIIDTTDPANLRRIGGWDSPGSAEGVTVAGTHAYIADGPFGVQLVEITDPAAPRFRSSVADGYFAFDVAISGSHAFVAAAGSGLLIADVADAANPRVVSMLDTPGYARAISMSDSIAYLADQWGGVRIIDVAHRFQPRELGSIAIQGWAFDVVATGSMLHVAAGSDGYRLYGTSEPAEPRHLSSHDVPWNFSWKVGVAQNRAFLGIRTRGVTILEVREAAPVRPLGVVSPLSNVQSVSVRGTVAFVGTENQGLRTVDLSDATRPRERGRGDTNDYVWAVAADDAHAYTCEAFVPVHFLRAYGVSNPAQPVRVASPRIPQGHCRDLLLTGTSLYVPDEFGLQIWDVSNPNAPSLKGTIDLPESGGVDRTSGVESVDVSGSTAFVDTQRGITAIDVSDPQRPRIAGDWVPQVDYPVQFSDVDVDGQFVYGVTGIPFPELYVVEAKEGARLVTVGSTRLPAAGQRVLVRESMAYVAAGSAGVVVVDVKNPAAPFAVTRIAVPGFAKEVTFVGERLLVAASDGGLVVLEQTSAPSSAQLPAAVVTPHELPRVPHVAIAPPIAPRSPIASDGAGIAARTVIVTSAADSGAGTLRDALTNLAAGDTILFDGAAFPPNAPATIRLETALPRITRDGITIDASNAGVILDGSALRGTFDAGIQINSRGNTVKGLEIVNFPYAGIWITGNGGNVIGGDRLRGIGRSGEGNVISANRSAGITILNPNGNRIVGNLIGTDVTGRQGLGRQNIGVEIFYQPGNGDVTGSDRIGGVEPWEANVISGNEGAEVYLHNGRGHSVIGNFLGTDPTGSMRVGSCHNGVATSVAAGNVIAGNVIAGNQFGVFIIDPGSHSNLIANNWIGVTKSGVPLTTNPYNGGVAIFESFNAVVGNSIRNGVSISNNRGNVAEAIVIGNRLGPGPLPANPPGQAAAVRIDTAWRTFVGGATTDERNSISGSTTGIWIHTPGIDRTFILGNDIRSTVDGIDLGFAASTVVQGNVITGNTRGVRVSAPTNLLRRNAIYANSAAAISIDAGATLIPQPPRIAEVTLDTVRGMACALCTVEIYSDAGAQGQWYEGSTLADAAGSFSFTTSAILRGQNVTATATDAAASTSAFSQPVARPPLGPRRRAVRH